MKFKYEDMVRYRMPIGDPHSDQHLCGMAIVKGVAKENMFHSRAVVGDTYILEDLFGNFPNDDYQYRFFTCFECHMEKAR
jgi:hypothetical protein